MTQRRIYQDEFPYFVTIVTHDRIPLFLDPKAASRFASILRGSCMLKGYWLLAYAVLPDHVHLLVWKDPHSRGVGIPERGLENPRSKKEAATPAIDMENPRWEVGRNVVTSSGTQSDVEMGIEDPSMNQSPASFKRGLSSPRSPEQNMYFANDLSRARREMSNHADANISQLIKSIKGTFSRSMIRGQTWQPRFYALIVGDQRYYENVLTYIAFNHQKHRTPKRFSCPPYVFIQCSLPD